jgi:biotin-(acetyl-CoA carboxylase) ligase
VQTRGRGRAGRSWRTEPGKGLALSLLMHAGCAPARVRAARGVDAARGVIRSPPGLRWRGHSSGSARAPN